MLLAVSSKKKKYKKLRAHSTTEVLSVPEVLPKMAEKPIYEVGAGRNSAALNQRTSFTVTQPAVKKNLDKE